MGSLSRCPFVSGLFHFVMFSRLIPVICIYQGFLPFYCSIVFHCMEIPHFSFCLSTHQLVDVWVVSSILVIIYNATMIVYKFLHGPLFLMLLGTYISGNGLHLMVMAQFLRICQTVLQKDIPTQHWIFLKRGCTILHSHQRQRVSFSPLPFPHLLLSFLQSSSWVLRNVYTPIPLMADKEE